MARSAPPDSVTRVYVTVSEEDNINHEEYADKVAAKSVEGLRQEAERLEKASDASALYSVRHFLNEGGWLKKNPRQAVPGDVIKEK